MGGRNLSADDYDNLERAAETRTREETRREVLREVADFLLRASPPAMLVPRQFTAEIAYLAQRIRHDDLH
jgi:hypothetical protein